MSKTSARYSRVFVPCQHFKPSLIFVRVENMKCQVDSGINHKLILIYRTLTLRLLDLPTIVGLGWKWSLLRHRITTVTGFVSRKILPGKNTLAYFSRASVQWQKKVL